MVKPTNGMPLKAQNAFVGEFLSVLIAASKGRPEDERVYESGAQCSEVHL